jgi:murein DD-endopeptidase MepM/ murein hydrolase activator NlpD
LFFLCADVIGLLGNSGNSDAPHLHFHVMDAPSPLLANGLPYVFRSFEGDGEVTDDKALDAREPAVIDTAVLAGPHRDQLPRDAQFVTFPAAAAR